MPTRIRPCDLPVSRPAPVSMLEFYYSSNERARSALGGRIVRGDDGAEREALNERHLLSGKEDRRVAVFFGGGGDGRQLLRTLEDVHGQLLSMPSEERDGPNPNPNPNLTRTLTRTLLLTRSAMTTRSS